MTGRVAFAKTEPAEKVLSVKIFDVAGVLLPMGTKEYPMEVLLETPPLPGSEEAVAAAIDSGGPELVYTCSRATRERERIFRPKWLRKWFGPLGLIVNDDDENTSDRHTFFAPSYESKAAIVRLIAERIAERYAIEHRIVMIDNSYLVAQQMRDEFGFLKDPEDQEDVTTAAAYTQEWFAFYGLNFEGQDLENYLAHPQGIIRANKWEEIMQREGWRCKSGPPNLTKVR